MNTFKNLLLAAILGLAGMAGLNAQTVGVGNSISIPVSGTVRGYSATVGGIITVTNAGTSLSVTGYAAGTTVLTINQVTGSNIVDTIVVTPKPTTIQTVTLNINQTLTLNYPSGTYVTYTGFSPNNGSAQLTSLTQTSIALLGLKTGTTTMTLTTTDAVFDYNITVTGEIVATYTAQNLYPWSGLGAANSATNYENYSTTGLPNNPSVPTYVTIVPSGNAEYQQLVAGRAAAEAWAATKNFYTYGVRRYNPPAMFGTTSLVGQGMVTVSYPTEASQIVLENTYYTAYLNNVAGNAGTAGYYYDPRYGKMTVTGSASTPTNAVYGSAAAGGVYNYTGYTSNRGWISVTRVPSTPLSIVAITADDDAGYGTSYQGYAISWVAPGTLPNDPPPPSGTIQSTSVRILPTAPATMSWTISNG